MSEQQSGSTDRDDKLSVGERIQNVKTEYDLSIDDHTEAKCQLCEKMKEDVRLTDVQSEASGNRMSVDLCPDCRELTVRYNRGEDVDWLVDTETDGGQADE
jgi:hypothetical protein